MLNSTCLTGCQTTVLCDDLNPCPWAKVHSLKIFVQMNVQLSFRNLNKMARCPKPIKGDQSTMRSPHKDCLKGCENHVFTSKDETNHS